MLYPVPSTPETAPDAAEEIAPPAGLSAEAQDLFSDVCEEYSDKLTPTQYAALIQACRLITLADAAHAAIGDNWLVPGYRNQGMVINPCATEERLARAAAVQALKSAGLDIHENRANTATNAGRALVRHRWSQR
jgi:hypothetical protein